MKTNDNIKPLSTSEANKIDSEELMECIRGILFEITKRDEELELMDNDQMTPEEFYYYNYADYTTMKYIRKEWKMRKLKPILINLITIIESIIIAVIVYICVRLG